MFDRIVKRFNERKKIIDRIEKLEKYCEKLEKCIERLNDKNLRVNKRIDTLERINRYYCDIKPKVRIETGMVLPGGELSFVSTLYIYNLGEEFKIDMDNMEKKDLNAIYYECNKVYDCEVKDDLAYVTFRNDKKKCTYKYIVDYHNNKYVKTVEEDPIQEVSNE